MDLSSFSLQNIFSSINLELKLEQMILLQLYIHVYTVINDMIIIATSTYKEFISPAKLALAGQICGILVN